MKSRNDSIARRATLSAPVRYHPRLLLCSGNSRFAIATMINRLGQLGDVADVKNIIYSNLLAPSASGRRDGNKRDILGQLLCRVSSYLRRYNFSVSDPSVNISNTFLLWLFEECKSINGEIPIQGKQKKAKVASNKILASLDCATSVLAEISNEEMIPPLAHDNIIKCDNMAIFRPVEAMTPLEYSLESSSSAITALIEPCIKENQWNELGSCLRRFYDRITAGEVKGDLSHGADALLVAIKLLSVYLSIGLDRDARVVNNWLPRLTRNQGNPDLWKLLFQTVSNDSGSSKLHSILVKCMATWTTVHVKQCMDWILSLGVEMHPCYDYNNLALFLFSMSEQRFTPMDQFSPNPLPAAVGSIWAGTKDFVVAATTIAICSFRQMSSSHRVALYRRNSVPSGLALCTLIGKSGKKQLRSVCDVLMTELNADNVKNDTIMTNVLEVVLLRLYLLYPNWMDLGSSLARTALIRATEKNANIWDRWISYYDDRIDSILGNCISGDIGTVKSLFDMSRKQPLLILRKLPKITNLLDTDATVLKFNNRNKNRANLPIAVLSTTAMLNGQSLKVHILHWGYSYNESLWMMMIDILLAMPREVLFHCGTNIGFLDLFVLYLELLSVQVSIHRDNGNLPVDVVRFQDKMGDVIKIFQQCNIQRYQEWILQNVHPQPHAVNAKKDDFVKDLLQRCQ
jgi:hypothetical protein